MTIPTMCLTLALAALSGAGLGCGDDFAGDDSGTDHAGDSAEGGADADADADADAAAEVGPATCGNGVVEPPEVCDDGNMVNEACRTTRPTDCLADCSLLMSACGNGALDPGEECDDGNLDSYDSCTSSCTINDHDIGDPCRCTAGCVDQDPTAGTIVGCDNVEVPADGSATLACSRSISSTAPPVTMYSAEGSCMLLALSCAGGGPVCGMAPVTGDVDAFACPPGFVTTTNVQTVMGATLTSKVCLPPCDSQSDCRWNAYELDGPFAGTCGQWQCLQDVGSGRFVCGDPRRT